MTRTKIILPKESGCWWQEVPSRDSGFVEPDCAVTGIFSLSRFFEWDSKHAGIMHWAEVQMEDESIRRVPAVRLHREFWSEQAECTPEAIDQLLAVDAKGQEISKITGDIWLFLADEAF